MTSEESSGVSGLVSSVFKLPNQAMDGIQQALALIPRAARLIDEVEVVVGRANAVVTEVEATVARSNAVVDATATVVNRASELVERITALTDGMAPALTQLQPILDKLAATTDPNEVDAMVKLIDMLPELADKMQADIVPILDTLGTVAPDLRDLLDVAREVNEIIGSVPGLRGVKKRVEEQQADERQAEYRADEEPPSAPARRTRQKSADQPAADPAPADPSAVDALPAGPAVEG